MEGKRNRGTLPMSCTNISYERILSYILCSYQLQNFLPLRTKVWCHTDANKRISSAGKYFIGIKWIYWRNKNGLARVKQLIFSPCHHCRSARWLTQFVIHKWCHCVAFHSQRIQILSESLETVIWYPHMKSDTWHHYVCEDKCLLLHLLFVALATHESLIRK